MAAFCACCGAEITLKAEACPVCGTPLHGMSRPELPAAQDAGEELSREETALDEDGQRHKQPGVTKLFATITFDPAWSYKSARQRKRG